MTHITNHLMNKYQQKDTYKTNDLLPQESLDATHNSD